MLELLVVKKKINKSQDIDGKPGIGSISQEVTRKLRQQALSKTYYLFPTKTYFWKAAVTLGMYGRFLVLVTKDLTCRLNILCSNPFLGGSGG